MGALKWLKEFGSKHGSTSCTIASVLGVGFTVLATWKVKPKVDKILDEQNLKKKEVTDNKELDEEERKKALKKVRNETIKRVGVASIPIVVAGGATAGFAVASRAIDSHKITDMAAAISLGDIAYQKLESKTKEVIGEEKLNEIKAEIAKDDVVKITDSSETWVDAEYGGIDFDATYTEQAYGGDQVFYDFMTGALFRSDVHTIEKACDELNRRMVTGGSKADTNVTYNEFRNEIGLHNVMGGDYFGWGLYSPGAQQLEPNMNNTIRIGDGSTIVLDWYTRPDTHFS